MNTKELAAKIWEAISIVGFLDLEGKYRNEEWLYRSLQEFEEEIREDERRKCDG